MMKSPDKTQGMILNYHPHIHQYRLINQLVSSTESALAYITQCSMHSDEFIDEFAHKNCFVLCDGFLQWGRQINMEIKGVIVKENGVALHYFNTFQLHGKTYYLDAYGLFDSLDPIKSRYKIDDEFFGVHVFTWEQFTAGGTDDMKVMQDVLKRIRDDLGGIGQYQSYRNCACRLLMSSLVGFLGE
ncbi:hypothetical protein J4N45_10955 [Vibrio sp. SCSIO 43140]|uniref:hypothetical protein n=1 Tax=Vibrio sp. SCSIO 43140 TaxID=2819100 RepID=UPI002074D3F1|nr:hypothetical protein [Vibrio sp. SCSIO 43140]USD59049.1 hypothetical protein J4N45_10955 [Vibrio sp. SCSIO 43140]